MDVGMEVVVMEGASNMEVEVVMTKVMTEPNLNEVEVEPEAEVGFW